MDFDIYERSRRGHSSGDKFDGHKSRTALERVLGAPFGEDLPLVSKLQEWGGRLLGRGAFGGANTSKWRFLTFAIPGREPRTDYPDEITQPEAYFEGASKTISVNAYERDAKARAACIAHHGPVCAICKLNFIDRYGQIGEGFIRVHHLKPLAEIGETYQVDPVRDLCPVCPNCHAMLHRRTPCMNTEELQARFIR